MEAFVSRKSRLMIIEVMSSVGLIPCENRKGDVKEAGKSPFSEYLSLQSDAYSLFSK